MRNIWLDIERRERRARQRAAAPLLLVMAAASNLRAAPPPKPPPVVELDTWAGSQIHRHGAIDLGAALVHPMGTGGMWRPGLFVAQNRLGVGLGVKALDPIPIAVGVNYLEDFRDHTREVGGFAAIAAAF